MKVKKLAFALTVLITLALSLAACKGEVSYFESAIDINNRMSPQLIGQWDSDTVLMCNLGDFYSCNVLATESAASIPILTKGRAEFSGLQPPPEAEDWHSAYLTMLDRGIFNLTVLVNSYNSGDSSTFEQVIFNYGFFVLEADRLSNELNERFR